MLKEKNISFLWIKEQEKAFQDFKDMLGRAPILVHPRSKGEFVLDMDASNEGICTIFSQIQELLGATCWPRQSATTVLQDGSCWLLSILCPSLSTFFKDASSLFA